MPKPKHSDSDVIAVWKRLGSPELVSKELGLTIRQVYGRRNSIERRHGIILPSYANDRTGRGSAEENLPKRGIRRETEIAGTVIVFSDAHFWPAMQSVAYKALLTVIKDMKPSMVVCNGDAFDGARISRHDPIGWENRAYPLPRVPDEVEAVREAMDAIRIAYRGARHVWNLGNHDIRLARYLAMNASEVEGLLGTSLDDHVRHWDIGWSLMLNGNTMIKHRYNNGIHATYNNTLKAGTSMVTGHLHRLNVTAWGDYNGRRYGVDTGTLLEIGPDVPQTFYAEDNPAPHGSGFAVLTYDKSGMLLPPELCEVINGNAYFRGGAGMKIVRVWWKDTIGGHKQGWRTLKSMIQSEPDECQAVGFLLHEDRDKIIIVPNYSDDSGDGEIVIPAAWVTKQEVLADE